jgi:hypothetical protein
MWYYHPCCFCGKDECPVVSFTAVRLSRSLATYPFIFSETSGKRPQHQVKKRNKKVLTKVVEAWYINVPAERLG